MKIEAVKVRRLYLQVAEQLARFISDGELKPGDRLPSERDLANQFGVSRPTVYDGDRYGTGRTVMSPCMLECGLQW